MEFMTGISRMSLARILLAMILLASAVILMTSPAVHAAPPDQATISATTPKADPTGSAPDYGLPQVRFINEQIRQVWTDNQMSPSPPATDGEWCRRVFLDVLGRTPSVQELREFTGSKEPDKKAKLVTKMLSHENYT